MKKLLLIFILFFPIASYAQNILVAKNKNGLFYIDIANIKENNGNVYYWVTLDFLKPAKSPAGRIMSVKLLLELNCKTPKKERVLTSNSYDRPMAKGELLLSDNGSKDWKYHTPDSTGASVMEYVCNLTTK